MPQVQKYAGIVLIALGWISFAISVTTTAAMIPNMLLGQIPFLVIVLGALIACACFGLTRLGTWLRKRGEDAEREQWSRH